MLTPMDIHNKEFKRGFRGYSEEDVDSFMDELASDYENVYREYCELKEKAEKMQDKLAQYEKMESTMNSTLMLAQQTAENVKVAARKEADLILQEAEAKKRQMLDSTTMNMQTTQQNMDKMKTQINSFKAKVRLILEGQLRLLDDMQFDGEAEVSTPVQEPVVVKEPVQEPMQESVQDADQSPAEEK
jgi:cell division initiation protein